MAITQQETCIYCGKTRTYRYSERTPDMDGRSYIDNSWCDDKGCDCDMGKAKANGFKLKKMCMNCMFNTCSECTNKEMKKEISSQFSVERLAIKDLEKGCKYWKIDNSILEDFC